MGREIRRVPLDFTWPLSEVWRGFLNPYPEPKRCADCDGTGLNAATKALEDDWYDFAKTGRRWCDALTQDEVDLLVAGGNLYELTHVVVPGRGWQAREPAVHPTAAEVNAWSRQGLGHDAIARGLCVEARAKRLGVFGHCATCRGRGVLRMSRKLKKRYLGWRRMEPPTGPGWQVWETVSEGSPITPVFAEPEALIAYLVEHDDYSVEAASRFVRDVQWTPSLAVVNGHVLKDIEICQTLDVGTDWMKE